MKKRKFLLAWVFGAMLAPMAISENVRCECDVVSDDGSYKNTYAYHVGEGQGCCTGTVSTWGTNTLYTNNQGVWQWVSSDPIAGNDAHEKCCPNV
ncbi:MAG: hypothetical protein ACE5FF_00075 [Saprospiraceae bacterium]